MPCWGLAVASPYRFGRSCIHGSRGLAPNAQQQLFPAELQAVQTNAGSYIAVINVYKALGGGWIAKGEALTIPIETAEAGQAENKNAVPSEEPKKEVPSPEPTSEKEKEDK